MSNMDVKQILKDANVVKEGHFILRSGQHSNLYINKDEIILNPMAHTVVISQLISEVFRHLDNNDFDIVTGPAVAGICFAAPVALRMGKQFVYPEKQLVKIGENSLGNLQEYNMVFRDNFKKAIKGRRVILIEDIITTGGSVDKTAQAIFDCGGDVVGICCIWNRNPTIKYMAKWSTMRVFNDIMYTGTNCAIQECPDTSSVDKIPVYCLVSETVESWEEGECPLCKQCIPLTDPKTGEIINV